MHLSLVSFALYSGGGFILLILSVLLLWSAYIAYQHWKYSHIPSPERPSFFFGHLSDIQKLKKDIEEELPFSEVVKFWSQKVDCSTFVIFLAHQPLIVTIDPEVVKDVIMNKDHPKSKIFWQAMHTVFGVRLLGDGILNERHYDKWKPRRKLYDPAFYKVLCVGCVKITLCITFRYLKTLISTFNEAITSVIDELRPLADGKMVVPLKKYISNITLDIISKVAFGTDFSKQWTAESLGIKIPEENQSNILYYIVNQSMKAIQVGFECGYPPLSQYLYPIEARQYKKCIRALRRIGEECIMKRIRMIQNGQEVPQDILTHMLKSNIENTNIEDLVDDFISFYIAGQDTTTNALMFCLILLFQHPNVMERLQQEINDILGNRTFVTDEDLENLKFTEQVLRETLRLYPATTGVLRCIETAKVIGNYHFPAGTEFMLSPSNISRLPQYFDDPDTFKPDRFHPDNQKPNSFVYLPFGAGQRSCIGKHMAMMEGKIILARLLQTFKMVFPSDYKLTVIQRTTLQPKDDLECTIMCN